MTDQKKIDASTATEISAKAADAALNSVSANTKTVTETAKAVVATAAKAAPKAAKAVRKPARKAKRTAAKTAKRVATKRVAAKKATARKIINSAAPRRAATQRTISMTNNDYFKGFQTLPTFAPFQDIVSKAGENSQQFAQRGQKVAEELADLARANVEAFVEAGRVASEGARALGQDAVSTSRKGFEKAADAVRTLAEAKSPTEYLQLQGEFARASFDRMVSDGSKLTETMVKLAGEAFQPIQNRAAKNAERFNNLVA